ncbi:MAG: hypothetical protein CMH57_12395 [Myxococcales bacterium]|nr:hypothetical protein [Myxococcales bacterium]
MSAAAWLTTTAAIAQPSPDAHKLYAVIIANNTSVDQGVAPLRYADDDGARYWELFSSAANAEVHLLTTLDNESQLLFDGLAPQTRPPARAQVLSTLQKVRGAIARDRAQGVKTTLFVVFAGHGAIDEKGVGYLSLSDAPFTRQDLYREVISPQAADRTHLIIDACNAYYMVRSRNGEGGDDRSGESYDDEFMRFLEQSNQLSQAPTVGVFVSTTGAAEVHEWSRYRGGVFSHQLRSGLLGAADVDGDLDVTYQELEAYLAAANASVTNPRARINVFAQAPAQSRHESILELDQLKKATFLELDRAQEGRYHLEDSRGVRYADFHKGSGGVMRIALLWEPLWRAPHYFIRTDRAEARVAPDSGPRVHLSGLPFVERADSARGSVEEAYRLGLFATPYGPGFFQGYSAALDRNASAQVAVVAPAEEDTQLGLQLGLGASQAPLRLNGPHTNLDASLDLWLTPRFALQLVGQFGTGEHEPESDELSAFRLNRIMAGVGATWRWHLPASFVLEANGRTGHQWFVLSTPDQRAGDALALRAELGGLVGYMLSDGLKVGLRGGAAVDVYTEDDREKVSASPFLGVVIGYQR